MTENRRKRNKAGIIWLFLMLIWLTVIFLFSAKKADESTVMSHSVGKLIGNIVIPEYRSWPEDKQEQFAEKIDFPAESFDVITACQCFWYFDHESVMPNLYRMLKPGGKLLALYMAWLPYEDEIAGRSEELVLKYSPAWSGAGETMHPIQIPDCYNTHFDLIHHEEYKLDVHFSRDSWHGRMKACRGVGASLNEEELQSWEQEHLKLLSEIAPEEFDIKHYAALVELKARK